MDRRTVVARLTSVTTDLPVPGTAAHYDSDLVAQLPEDRARTMQPCRGVSQCRDHTLEG